MTDWSLSKLLAGLHRDIRQRLDTIRDSIQHPVAKGDSSEKVWIDLFKKYLPKRYSSEQAFIVDSEGKFSEQIDVVIFDRQYTPFIFEIDGAKFVPAESVYAVFEAKQAINAGVISYAKSKAASVRRLHRTSLPIPHAGGTFDPKPAIPIMAGVLSFESEWSPPLGETLRTHLYSDDHQKHLDLGCIVAHGHFYLCKDNVGHTLEITDKAATAFLFKLISRLQFSGTVPMIDIEAYARWLTD